MKQNTAAHWTDKLVELWADALGLQKLYLKDQPRFKGQGDVIG